MTHATRASLVDDLRRMGVRPGDGVFVHASFGRIAPVVGGPRSVLDALLETVGPEGLLAMPGFSTDAYMPPLPPDTDSDTLRRLRDAVPGHDPARSPTAGMGISAELFRSWPGTVRSGHPAVSICVNGAGADDIVRKHALEFATGPGTPLGEMIERPGMKILLLGVDWTRCSALHTAETLAKTRRLKTRMFKHDGQWLETPDVADDNGRLFPRVGAAFEARSEVTFGRVGHAEARLCDFAGLVHFASDWIGRANLDAEMGGDSS